MVGIILISLIQISISISISITCFQPTAEVPSIVGIFRNGSGETEESMPPADNEDAKDYDEECNC